MAFSTTTGRWLFSLLVLLLLAYLLARLTALWGARMNYPIMLLVGCGFLASVAFMLQRWLELSTGWMSVALVLFVGVLSFFEHYLSWREHCRIEELNHQARTAQIIKLNPRLAEFAPPLELPNFIQFMSGGETHPAARYSLYVVHALLQQLLAQLIYWILPRVGGVLRVSPMPTKETAN
ncbi:MAG: hypothetical protein SFX18_20180 [Pirellulales bacterium]|nr:hypothetical protein [Pirellulales bacterium]